MKTTISNINEKVNFLKTLDLNQSLSGLTIRKPTSWPCSMEPFGVSGNRKQLIINN